MLARTEKPVDTYFALSINNPLSPNLKVLVEIRQQLGEDSKLRFNITQVKIYIPDVSRARARELVTGPKCVGVPIGRTEFVNAFV